MQIGPFTFGRTKQLELAHKALPQLRGLTPGRNGWWPWGVIRESFTGAWQNNVEIRVDTALSFFAVYSCVRLISTDIGKLGLGLVQQDENGIWTATESPSFSPVLRSPNRYQHIGKFIEQWILSKLIHGNAYVLLGRDGRRVVTTMYVLDPTRVTPLVTPAGDVYYELKRDDLSRLPTETVVVPASEIIHDTMIAPFHPLIGLSPLTACGLAASQGLSIQNNSQTFFSNGSFPGGFILVPGEIGDVKARELKAQFETNFGGDNIGSIGVLGDGMSFQPATGFINAHDSQLIEQLKMTAEQVCSAFGVPPYLVDIGPAPPYANFEPLLLKYHSQCIQSLTTNFEKSLDKGLGLIETVEGKQYGTEFDIDDLIWMDTETRVNSAKNAIGGGGMSFDEARKKYHGLGPVPGGNTPWIQEQNWPINILDSRELPERAPQPTAQPSAAAGDDDVLDMAASWAALHKKSIEAGLYAA